jgi:enoyl-CoA hydratase/carnithine racemase
MSLKEYLRSGHTDNDGVHHDWSNFDLELLPSVGCVINNKNGDTFPLLANGDIDFSDDMNVVEMYNDQFNSEEWFNSLHTCDKPVVNKVLMDLLPSKVKII